jgi:hypothetical protein
MLIPKLSSDLSTIHEEAFGGFLIELEACF